MTCPDCAQPIALLADEDTLPEHALCRLAVEPVRADGVPGVGPAGGRGAARPTRPWSAQEQDAAVLLTLPQGLDWRTQPFSHVGGPGIAARMRVPRDAPPAA